MSEQAPPTSDPLPSSIHALCDRFEVAWKVGERPRIEDWLAQVPTEHHPRVFRELLAVELWYRRRSGDTVYAEGFYARFPAILHGHSSMPLPVPTADVVGIRNVTVSLPRLVGGPGGNLR
jgi:hypothetical protein